MIVILMIKHNIVIIVITIVVMIHINISHFAMGVAPRNPAPTGVREINIHPTRRQCRPPPIRPMSMFTDTRKMSAIGL